MKSRIKAFTADSRVVIVAQIKLGLFWTNIADYPVTYARREDECIALAKARIEQFKAAGFNSQGVIEL